LNILFTLRLHVAARTRQPSLHFLGTLHAERSGINHILQRNATALSLNNFGDRVKCSDESRQRFDVIWLHEVDFVDDDDLRARGIKGTRNERLLEIFLPKSEEKPV
jgi:hypothetical protein